MALSNSFLSYPPTLAEFIAHWNALNASRGTPFELRDGSTVATMIAKRDAIEAAISTVNAKAASQKDVSLDRAAFRAAFRARMDEFRRAANYYLADKVYRNNLKPLPPVSASDAAYLDVADALLFVWKKAQADNIQIVLSGEYLIERFEIEIGQLQNQPLQGSNATLSTATERDERDDLLRPARELMKEYGAAIRAIYPPDSPTVRTLPRLWERDTPDPDAPKLRVEYTPGSSSARAKWEPIADPTVTKIYVKIAPGARYTEKNARRLAELAPNVVSYDLPEGTIAPGSTNWLKIFALDANGSETGSNTVKIERAA